MKVGIIGSGGREHVICYSLKKSNKIDEIFCFPGNAGTSSIAKNVNIDLQDFNKFKDYIKDKKIDLIIVGPEKPLVDGIVDFLELNKIKVFGPDRISSQLEGSKIFTKNLCKKYDEIYYKAIIYLQKPGGSCPPRILRGPWAPKNFFACQGGGHA